MESVDHAANMLPAAATNTRTSSRRAVRLPFAKQKRAESILVALLAALYGGSVYEPALAGRPGALCSHLLVLVAAAVVFLGLWDTLALLSLRRLLRRDLRALWRKYARSTSLQHRLDCSSFELDGELAGGLVAGGLRRFVALGRPEGDLLPRSLNAALRATRIGSTSLALAATAAPILGLLGAIMEPRPGLRAGEPLLPMLESMAVPLGLGLAIPVIAMTFSQLLGRCVAEECAAMLAPVVEASRGTISRRSCRVEDRDGANEERMRAWMVPPWSGELRRYRWATALLSWIGVAGLILLIDLPV